jgi:hypothetical protein
MFDGNGVHTDKCMTWKTAGPSWRQEELPKDSEKGQHHLDTDDETLLSCIQTFFQDRVASGGLSQAFCDCLDKLDNIKPKVRNEEDFIVDPLSTSRSIKTRDPNLLNIFTPVELELYNLHTRQRQSNRDGEDWLRYSKKVCILQYVDTVMYDDAYVD